MGRPRKGNVKLSAWIPPALLSELRIQAVQRGGSVGDAICKLHEQAGNRDETLEELREQLKAARLAEKGALDAARSLVVRVERAEKRLAAMSAQTKARQRGAFWATQQ